MNYEGQGYEKTPTDLVESLEFNNRPGSGGENDLVPETPETFKKSLQIYWDYMSSLFHKIMEISALALGYNSNFFVPYCRSPYSCLRLAYYPAQSNIKPERGQLRFGAHTDYRRISCHGRNYSQPYFFKRNQSSDNRSHGFCANIQHKLDSPYFGKTMRRGS